MNDHEIISTLLPEYVAGKLNRTDTARVENHLKECQDCQQDLQLWQWAAQTTQETSAEHQMDPNLFTPVLFKIRAVSRKQSLQSAWLILRSQLPIVQKEIWSASVVILFIGYIASVLVDREVIFQVLAPLVAASSFAVLFGSDHDPAAELSLASPVSPIAILLARLVLVFSFNLALALCASIGIAISLPAIPLGNLILSWLAPMSLLCSLALFLSIQFRTETALISAYVLWLLRSILPAILPRIQIEVNAMTSEIIDLYLSFWSQTGWMIGLSIGLIALTLWVVKTGEYKPRTVFG